MADYGNRPIIIKKIKKTKHAHHGGAWKIAYADFVTAMMAFFLLLWLISMTTPEQKQGLADYFAPPNVSATVSGAGGVLGGAAIGEDGAQQAGSASDPRLQITPEPDSTEFSPRDDATGGQAASNFDAVKASQTELQSRQDRLFTSAAASIRQAWQALPDIAEIAENLVIEKSPEGLDIQLLDDSARPMFPEGSRYPYETTRQAIAVLAPILERLPNQIAISGHTAAGAVYDNPRYGSWELSTDRANTARAILGEFGLSDSRIHSVTGRSSAEPYLPNDPYLSANSRITITVLYAAPPVPLNLTP
ncbi:MAG TPA: flagellar motor protein MotB [Devosiaceae bacterium]|nr:flagellar motor protein MotB [Devosiaceae bacterium]